MSVIRRLFVDLDGVGADFDKGYYEKFGHWPGVHVEDVMWANINSDPKFFATLPLISGFVSAIDEFVDAGYNPMFLTACPADRYQSIADQKHQWVREHVSHDLLIMPVVGGRNKARFLQRPGDILVDDFAKNLVHWTAVGGAGVLHRSWDESKETVHQLMRNP